MLETILGVESLDNITGISFRGPGGFAPTWLVALLLLAGVVLVAVYLYRKEERLSPQRRVVMTLCQGLALMILVIVLLNPVADVEKTKTQRPTMLVLLDTSGSMAIDDQRKKPEDIAEAARVLGELSLDASLTAAEAEKVQAKIGHPRRIDLARAAIEHPSIKLFDKLSENYNVRSFSFDDQLRPEGGAENPTDWLQTRQAEGESSKVGTNIEEAVARYTGQKVSGVVVLSDFAWYDGEDPANIAHQMREQGIPIYPIAVGLPDPPDVIMEQVIAPEVVFKGDRVPLRVKVDSRGYKQQTVELSLMVNGESDSSKTITLAGGVQFEEMEFIPREDSGTVQLELALAPLSGETSHENNSQKPQVRIIDEKIDVLYIEGMPRWEYRYLRWVLLRDPRLNVHFLMTQGDPELAAASPRHLARFPQDAEDLREYDLIILGDVPSNYFTKDQTSNHLETIKEMVTGDSGASLLMIAGPMAAPLSYRDTPIEELLPVEIGSGHWTDATSEIPVVTSSDRTGSATVRLVQSEEENQNIWRRVAPMHALPQLGGAKPGAHVLVTLRSDAETDEEYPLVAWHRAGTGKSMFVATEDLWRMRLEVGDKFHARFWAQAIQFLTLSRLLGQNKQITLETERRDYNTGDYVNIYANWLNESFQPVSEQTFIVVLEHAGEAAEITLTELPDAPGLYSGVYLAATPGEYKLRTTVGDSEVSNEVTFHVADNPLEKRLTAARPEVARQVAQLSGGKALSLSELAKLPGALGRAEPTASVAKIQMELWDAPLLFLMLVALAGTEWFLRRRNNLV